MKNLDESGNKASDQTPNNVPNKTRDSKFPKSCRNSHSHLNVRCYRNGAKKFLVFGPLSKNKAVQV